MSFLDENVYEAKTHVKRGVESILSSKISYGERRREEEPLHNSCYCIQLRKSVLVFCGVSESSCQTRTYCYGLLQLLQSTICNIHAYWGVASYEGFVVMFFYARVSGTHNLKMYYHTAMKPECFTHTFLRIQNQYRENTNPSCLVSAYSAIHKIRVNKKNVQIQPFIKMSLVQGLKFRRELYLLELSFYCSLSDKGDREIKQFCFLIIER